MSRWNMRAMLLATAAMVLANAGGTSAQETLPWGSTERPRVVTPDSGPPAPATGSPYARSYGSAPYGGAGRGVCSWLSALRGGA